MKKLIQLFVFISGTEDLAAEKKVIKSAIDELNIYLADPYGVQLVALGWESAVVPGIGADGQDVINSQMEGKYDIYLGLLSARFGTPTARAGSGTEEEFNSAHELYSATPEKVRVLFYFKITSENMFEMAADQLEKVRRFRTRLKDSAGVLFRDVSGPDELLRVVRDHLRLLISEQWDTERQQWKVLTAAPKHEAMPEQSALTALPAEIGAENLGKLEEDEALDEAGVLDALVQSNTAFQAGGVAASNLGKLLDKLTQDFKTRTAEIAFFNAGPNKDLTKLKFIVDMMARDIDAFATEARKELASISSTFESGLGGLETSVRLYFSENLGTGQELSVLPIQLQALIDTIDTSRQASDLFAGMVTQTPGMTGRFKRAKKRALAVLSDLSAEFTLFIDRTTQLRDFIVKNLGKSDLSGSAPN